MMNSTAPAATQADTCTNCKQPVFADGICQLHYFKTHDSKTINKGQCKVADCTKHAHSVGLCSPHYQQMRRVGKSPKLKQLSKLCTVDGCTRPLRAKGMCISHYSKDYNSKKAAAAKLGTWFMEPEPEVYPVEPVVPVEPVTPMDQVTRWAALKPSDMDGEAVVQMLLQMAMYMEQATKAKA